MQLQIDEQQQEVKDHGHYEFPVFISQEVLSRYERGSFIWHWHTEVELTLVVEGQISYQVNERVYELKAGDGLFCNSNALHTGRMKDKQDCYYISITFHPRILYGFEGSLIWKKFQAREVKRVLFMATGALMSPTAGLQGESIPGIAHGVVIERR